jgi:hypothetical protein
LYLLVCVHENQILCSCCNEGKSLLRLTQPHTCAHARCVKSNSLLTQVLDLRCVKSVSLFEVHRHKLSLQLAQRSDDVWTVRRDALCHLEEVRPVHCTNVCTCICMCIYLCIYKYTYVLIYIHMCTSMHIYTRAHASEDACCGMTPTRLILKRVMHERVCARHHSTGCCAKRPYMRADVRVP